MLRCFPAALREEWPEGLLSTAREIRLRAGARACVACARGEWRSSACLAPEQVRRTAQALCEHALYACQEQAAQGFATIEGGHRVGLCGQVIVRGGSVWQLREIASLCIRVAREAPGCARALLPAVCEGGVRPTLLAGAPGTGKTTLLRDLVRALSARGLHVGLCDERSEVAACVRGVAQLDVGENTDVLDGCPKAEGFPWLLRTMCPQVLVADELGGPGDGAAVAEALRCGVPVIATAHAGSLESLARRETLAPLLRAGAFERVALLASGQVGKVAVIAEGADVCALG